MSRGRIPEPAQSKVLKGNFRKDRDGHGPQVKIKLPACPAWLPKEAKRYWKVIGPQLLDSGLIADIDGAVFTAHCDSVGRYEQVAQKLKFLDDLIDSTPNGFEVQSALFQIRNKLWDQIIRSAQEFGLSPAARTKMKTLSGQGQLPLGGFDDL